MIFLPADEGCISYILVEELILHYADKAFEGYKIEEKALMRVTRNADIDVDEDLTRNLISDKICLSLSTSVNAFVL